MKQAAPLPGGFNQISPVVKAGPGSFSYFFFRELTEAEAASGNEF